MKIGRIIAITAVVCAAIGMTAPAEAAKKKSANLNFTGCAYYKFCGPFAPAVLVMTADIAGNLFVFNPPGSVPPFISVHVRGQNAGETYIGWCRATQVNVVRATPTGKSCPVN
jgi:hypothetical protein